MFKNRHRYFKIFLYLLYVLVAVFICMEIILRIFNPFPVRLRGDTVILPVNQVYEIENTQIPKLDRHIHHTKNGLGFRGENKPADFENRLSIVTIGGSTTECFYLSDSLTWPHLLGLELEKTFPELWLNNAGIDGHSTYGHRILMQDFVSKLKPKVALFLVGGNDLFVEGGNGSDQIWLNPPWWKKLKEKSEVFCLLVNISRTWQAWEIKHSNFQIRASDTLTIPRETIREKLNELQPHREAYRIRLRNLLKETRQAGIEPILITQPTLAGPGTDPITGADLQKLVVSSDENGELYWEVLNSFNTVTRETATETGTPLIDLAEFMPRNSLYFYDKIHYSNAGAAKVAEIIAADLKRILAEKFPAFAKQENLIQN